MTRQATDHDQSWWDRVGLGSAHRTAIVLGWILELGIGAQSPLQVVEAVPDRVLCKLIMRSWLNDSPRSKQAWDTARRARCEQCPMTGVQNSS